MRQHDRSFYPRPHGDPGVTSAGPRRVAWRPTRRPNRA